MAKVVNRLTHAEHFRMAQWLLTQTLMATDSYAGLAKRYSEDATASQIKTAMETAGLSIPLPAEKQKEEDLAVVAAAVKTLFLQLGVAVPEKLNKICQAL